MKIACICAFALCSLIGCGAATPAKSVASKPAVGPGECPAAIDADAEKRAPLDLAGRPVARVCFLGSTRSTVDQLRAAVLSAEGQAFDSEKVARDLRHLYEACDLDDVHAYADATPAGVVLVYVVRDRPLLEEVRVEGASALSAAAVRGLLAMPTGAPFDPARGARQAEAVRAEYVSRGFVRAAVTTKLEPSSRGATRWIVKIDEGLRVTVAQVVFNGAKKIAEKELRQVLDTQVGDVFREDKLARVTILLTALYYDRGMLEVVVRRPPAVASADGSAMSIAFDISEGPVFKLGKLSFAGDLAVGEKEHTALLTAKPGQVFNRSALMDDIRRIVAFYKARGAVVEVEPETELHPEEGKVDLLFRVTTPKPGT